MLAETEVRYRLSRATLVRRRALRRIQKSRRLAHVRFGGEVIRESAPSERRHEIREAFHVPVYLRRVEVSGLTVTCDESEGPLLAVTQNLSNNGVGLVHDHPVKGTWFLVEFDVFAEQPLSLLVQIRWSKEVDSFSYRSGCRIAGVCRRVESPQRS